jgi:hypothetical protein
MAAQPERTPQADHTVHIRYPNGTLEVDDSEYPPPNLDVGQTIVFIPEEDGELELTFEWGSNFTLLDDDEIVGKSQTVRGHVLHRVERKMERDELEVLKAIAQKWSPANLAKLKLNAFPFRCKFTPANKDPEYPQATPPYTGGFPRPPRK